MLRAMAAPRSTAHDEHVVTHTAMTGIRVPVLVGVLFLGGGVLLGGHLRSGRTYQEIGPAEGQACRFFIIAVVPFGDSTFSTAVERALAEKGGDALINVTTSSSLYGFIPVYNILSFTCTTVKGIAVKFQ